MPSSTQDSNQAKEPRFTPYINQAKDWTPELVDAVAKALRAGMKKRGLWTAPPAWLGYENWNRWDENERENKVLAKTELANILNKYPDAFRDLLIGVFIEKSPQLIAIEQSQNIDDPEPSNRMIKTLVKNFLIDKQRKHDPVGRNVAKHAIRAVQCAIDKGILEARELSHKGKVYNPTLLTFSTAKSTTPSEKERIFEVLHNNQTWVEIRPKLAGKSEKVQERLCEIVCQLKDSGINCFRFKSLADAMKEEVRAIHPKPQHIPWEDFICKMEIDETANDEIEIQIPDILSEISSDIDQIRDALDTSYDDDQNDREFRDLCQRIRYAIDNSPYQEKVRKRLHRILTEFEQAIETEKEVSLQQELSRVSGAAIGSLMVSLQTEEKEIPSQQELSKLLKVALSTINKDMKCLRELVKKII